MPDIKLIATDMDHTLLTEAGELPPHFGDYLDQMQRAGIQFAVASGRPLYTLEGMFPEHKDQLVLICDNGAVIKQRGKIIAQTLLPNDDIRAMYTYVRDHTDGHAIICGLDGAVVDQADAEFDQEYRAFYSKLSYTDHPLDWDGIADKLTLYLPNHDAEQVFNDQLNPLWGDKYSVAVTADCWIDIMPKHVNKGTAMMQMSQLMGISADQMMAFGDNFNDKEMLQYVKYSYLVANAHPKMADYATYRTSSNQDFGVLKVIKQVLAKAE
jgi:Cof subfamily protein (haloacid dehalogenase superfamily)